MHNQPGNVVFLDGYTQLQKHAANFQQALERIYEKYGKDFDGIADEIDIFTGKILVDNGHVTQMEDIHTKTDGWGLTDDIPVTGGSDIKLYTAKKLTSKMVPYKLPYEQLAQLHAFDKLDKLSPEFEELCEQLSMQYSISGGFKEFFIEAGPQIWKGCEDTIILRRPKMPLG